MVRLTPRRLSATLLIFLLSGSATAFAQKGVSGLPGVNVGLTVPKVADVNIGVPRIEVPRTISAVPSVTLPKAEVKIEPAIVPGTGLSAGVGGTIGRPEVGLSATVPGTGGLNVSAGGPVTGPGAPPSPDPASLIPGVPQAQLAEKRLELLPTCR